ncbi:hypothetical protein E8E14_001791 [Neopestalotiopsis sp. 37M]|nr:hypothetical protein E8E14_001791 [Neopestalotiopsis sp. 37M]
MRGPTKWTIFTSVGSVRPGSAHEKTLTVTSIFMTCLLMVYLNLYFVVDADERIEERTIFTATSSVADILQRKTTIRAFVAIRRRVSKTCSHISRRVAENCVVVVGFAERLQMSQVRLHVQF